MESMSHSQHANRKKPTAKTSVVASVIFHVLIAVAVFYWAAHEGMLGKKLQLMSASILDKEKKIEPKKDEPKEDAKKAEAANEVKAVKAAAAAPSTDKFVPPPAAADVAAAPPPVVTDNSFVFAVAAIDDPVVHYKEQIETQLRSKWQRPSDVLDFGYVAEIEISVDPTGRLASSWKKGSGDAKWDDSVKLAVEKARTIGRPPPKGFPDKVVVRFDVLQENDAVSLQ